MLVSTVTEYLAGADPRDPRCSAIFADMHGLPPLLIQVGENEILYDDAIRIRDAATRCQRDIRILATWNPRLAGVYLRWLARIRRRHRTSGDLFQSALRALNVTAIETGPRRSPGSSLARLGSTGRRTSHRALRRSDQRHARRGARLRLRCWRRGWR